MFYDFLPSFSLFVSMCIFFNRKKVEFLRWERKKTLKRNSNRQKNKYKKRNVDEDKRKGKKWKLFLYFSWPFESNFVLCFLNNSSDESKKKKTTKTTEKSSFNSCLGTIQINFFIPQKYFRLKKFLKSSFECL